MITETIPKRKPNHKPNITLTMTLLLTIITTTSALNGISSAEHPPQKEITAYKAGDLLLFESYPRSVAPAIIQETVDISHLFKIKDDIKKLETHATTLEKSQPIQLHKAEHFCPISYPSKITDSTYKNMTLPAYIATLEIPNKPTHTYHVILYEGTKLERHCNYSLTPETIHKVQSPHTRENLYYWNERQDQYDDMKRWLFDQEGEICKDKVNLNRGEIVDSETNHQTKINWHHGGMYSCAETCTNINDYSKQNTNINKKCSTYSYNWDTQICRISSNITPKLNIKTKEGYNALTSRSQCKSMTQHNKVMMLVNGKIQQVRDNCLFDTYPPIGSFIVHRNCVGQARALKTNILPIKSLLNSYLIQLISTEPQKQYKNNTQMYTHKIENLRKKRSIKRKYNKVLNTRHRTPRSPKLLTLAMTILRPNLMSFLSKGMTSILMSPNKVYVGSPFNMHSMLTLPNIISALVKTATETQGYSKFDTHEFLEPNTNDKYEVWNINHRKNLLSLEANNRQQTNIELAISAADAFPTLILRIHEILNKLQKPLYRLLNDPQPIANSTAEVIRKHSNVFGYWSKFNEDTNQIIRYYVYQVTGNVKSAHRQIAVLAGSKNSDIREGTTIAGAVAKSDTTAPKWHCIEAALTYTNKTVMPPTCYTTPELRAENVYRTPFIPQAEIIKIIGTHQIKYSCPERDGQIHTRNLCIILSPLQCIILINGAELRPHKPESHSVWTRVHTLINQDKLLTTSRMASYPAKFVETVSKLANKTTNPSIEKLESTQTLNNLHGMIIDFIGFPTMTGLMLIIGYYIKNHTSTVTRIRTRTLSIMGRSGPISSQVERPMNTNMPVMNNTAE